jgi:8-oxo-dGTP pyrophosphatase MutT (NUDIX family)
MEVTDEVAIVVLTDRIGRVLMQHRALDAHVEQGKWTPPGGRLEPGEDALVAARRELREETGVAAILEPSGVVDHIRADGTAICFHVFTGCTDASQDDVVVGEGLAMRFLTRAEIGTIPLASNAERFLDMR